MGVPSVHGQGDNPFNALVTFQILLRDTYNVFQFSFVQA